MRHRGCQALQAAVLSAPVVVSEEKRQGRAVVAPLLREAIGQTGHALVKCSDRAVHPLNVRGAYLVLLVEVAVTGRLVSPYYPGRRVDATRETYRIAVHLLHNAVI